MIRGTSTFVLTLETLSNTVILLAGSRFAIALVSLAFTSVFTYGHAAIRLDMMHKAGSAVMPIGQVHRSYLYGPRNFNFKVFSGFVSNISRFAASLGISELLD